MVKAMHTHWKKLQRSAARIVMRSNNSVCTLNYLKWSSLNQRRDSHVFTLVNKCIAGKCPSFFKHYFAMNRDIVSRTARQSNRVRLYLKLEQKLLNVPFITMAWSFIINYSFVNNETVI